MKKVLLSLLIVLVLVWNCSEVSAQDKGKAKGPGGQEKAKRERKSRQADANEPSEQGKEKRVRGRVPERVRELVQRKKHRKERQKIRVMRGKGKGHQQQLKALKAQMVHEEVKHRRRIARLKRIRELAAKENDTKTVERVIKLLKMELRRHERKRQRMQEKNEDKNKGTGKQSVE